MSPNSYFFYEGLARFMSGRLGADVRWVNPPDWQDGLRMLRTGGASLAAICGLQYVEEADDRGVPLVPMAAPVPAGERYGGKPVYLTELVVRHDSRYQTLEELGGARWAYNEPTSQSGFGIMAYALAERGLTLGFFEDCIESGSHLTSLGLLLAGEADVATIDSTVLELEFVRHPALRGQVRCIESLGPSPAPPIAASAGVPAELRARLRQMMASLHTYAEGRRLLREARYESLAVVDDGWYDEIRRMREVGRRALMAG